MGEYASFRNDRVKIGTCENMYYLRASQRHAVQALSGNVDPASSDRFEIRFRFPWPDEDGTEPGEFDRYDRSVWIPGYPAATDVAHYSIQFRADAGYLLSLPCPEGAPSCTPGFETTVNGLKVARNGFVGAVHLVQQKMLRDGRTVPVLMCRPCGARWRVEEPADIEALVVALRAEGDRKERDGCGAFWHAIADRIATAAQL